MGTDGSFCVLVDFNGFLWYFMGPYGSLRVLTGSSRYLFVFINYYLFLCVFTCPYVSL